MYSAAYKKVLKLALPMAFTQLITMGSVFLCMTMIATLGHTVLAASALIFSISMSISVIGMSLLFSLSVLVGHAYGAEDYLGIGSTVQHGWLLGILISIPLMLFFWNIYPILIFLGQEPKIALIVKQFFHANVWRTLPLMLSICNQQLCYGVHKQKIDLMANTLGVPILLIFSYLLIFGKFGFPALGVAGFGYAGVIQGVFYLSFTTWCLISLEEFKRFELFRIRLHKNWQSLTHLLKIGWPISAQFSGEMLSFFFITAMVGWLSVNALAAYQVVMQYMFITFVPIFALSQASSILISQACGSKQFQGIKSIGIACCTIALVISVIAAMAFLLIPKLLASVYYDVNNLAYAVTLHLTIVIFAISAASQMFDGVRNVLTGALRGMFDTRYPMFIGVAVIWLVGIPLSYVFAFLLHWGAPGIAAGSLCGMLIGAVLVIRRWYIVTARH